MWKSNNVTFVQTIYDPATTLTQQAGATRAPTYNLVLREWFPRHVTYGDKMSSEEIVRYLHFQLGFRASTLHRHSTYFSVRTLRAYAAARPLGSVVLGLCEDEAQEQEIAFAARRAAVPLSFTVAPARA